MARRAETAGDRERETVLGQEGKRALGAVEHRRDVEGTVLHQAVRGHLASFLAGSADRGGLPRFVERDFARNLACGVPGVRLRPAGLRWMPERSARPLLLQVTRSVPLLQRPPGARHRHPPRGARASPGAVPPVDALAAHAAALLSGQGCPASRPRCSGLFVRALFAFQRRTARRLGVPRPLTGAVAFVQRFGSALQLTPHFHVLVPEAVFEELDEAELRLHPLPRPTDAEVETLAVTVARRTLALLRARGVLEEEAVPDGALDVLQLEGIQVPRSGPRPPARRPGRRCAFVEGFSLHADTWLHENDVVGLERLCNYGARGPLSLERLSTLPDGRLAYRMKRPSPTGQTHLVLAPVAFLRRGGRARPAPEGQPGALLRCLRPQRPGAPPRRARTSSPCGAHRGSFLPAARERPVCSSLDHMRLPRVAFA